MIPKFLRIDFDGPLPEVPIVEESYFRFLTLNYPHGNVPEKAVKLNKLRRLKDQGLICYLKIQCTSVSPALKCDLVFSNLGKRMANRIHAKAGYEPFPEVPQWP